MILLWYLFIKMAIKLTLIIIEGYHCYQLANFIHILVSRLTPYVEEITGIVSVDFT